MSEEELVLLIRKMKRLDTRFSRKQLFSWETRNMTDEQRQMTENRLRELWNAQPDD